VVAAGPESAAGPAGAPHSTGAIAEGSTGDQVNGPIGAEPGAEAADGDHVNGPVDAEAGAEAADGDASTGPLDGVRVLDLTISFAGPSIGRVLADFGATVVKVESVKRPDLARTAGPFLGGETVDHSACFAHYNAGKRSLALDLSKPESRPVLADLARWADVLVESYAPGALARMGLDPETRRRLNPDLICLSTSMIGQTGPYADIAGYGNMASALCGFYSTTAWPDRDPVGPMGAYTDIISPRLATAAILAALDHHRRTGEGVDFDFGQGESCLQLLTLGLLDTQVNGRSWEQQGNDDLLRAPHGVYPAAGDDRWVAVAVETDEQWHALAGLLGREDLAGLDGHGRLVRRRQLDELVAGWTAAQEPAAVSEALQAAGVPAHAVQDGRDCLTDPQLHHRRWTLQAGHDAIGTVLIGRWPYQLSATPPDSSRAGPCLGEHTFEVLHDLLGYDEDRIADLAAAEVLE
jgi:crotonobetainyl-CoA:carnitine CoA-transferase CaiB-like acyl-CoA transferase